MTTDILTQVFSMVTKQKILDLDEKMVEDHFNISMEDLITIIKTNMFHVDQYGTDCYLYNEYRLLEFTVRIVEEYTISDCIDITVVHDDYVPPKVIVPPKKIKTIEEEMEDPDFLPF